MAYIRTANEFANDLDVFADYCRDLHDLASKDPDNYPFAANGLEHSQNIMRAILDMRELLGRQAGIIMDILTEDDVRAYETLFTEQKKMVKAVGMIDNADSLGVLMATKLLEKDSLTLRHSVLASLATQSYLNRSEAKDSPKEERN